MRLEKLGKKLEEERKEDGQVGKKKLELVETKLLTARAVNLDRSSGEGPESRSLQSCSPLERCSQTGRAVKGQRRRKSVSEVFFGLTEEVSSALTPWLECFDDYKVQVAKRRKDQG